MRRELAGTTLVADFAAFNDVDAIGELGGEAQICSARSTVTPVSFRRLSRSSSACTTSGARPSEGSSSSKSVGLPSSVRAMATMRCWPPESDEARR